ncbi:Spy/CpxP family protein refolding chaperone [Natroniella sp. ANB-PHB2]|uniref:Spy/CpxP family protein refolding chaperone n=1 Tax=Natroniella sp. ANB-PHB2 TaxID=3384444 RepID=UPI0038D40D24
MNKRIVSLVIVFILLAGFSNLGYGMMRGRNHRGYEAKDWDNLNLSQEESREIERLTDDHYRQIREISYQLRDKRYQLHDLYFDAEVSNNRIEEQQTEVKKLQGELDSLRADYKLYLRDILTTEQLNMLSAKGQSDCHRSFRREKRGSNFSHMGRGYHGGMVDWFN